MLDLLLAALVSSASPTAPCPLGLYRSPDGDQQAVITARPDGTSRYTFVDGRREREFLRWHRRLVRAG